MLFTRTAPDGGRDLVAVQARQRTVLVRRPGRPAALIAVRDPRGYARQITAGMQDRGWTRQPQDG